MGAIIPTLKKLQSRAIIEEVEHLIWFVLLNLV